jgi:Holliday junction resolvase RusA-like endonuclease
MENTPLIPISFIDDKRNVSCIIPGSPFAKQRPRASRRGRFTTMYTPKETVNYENLVKYSYFEQNGSKKLDGPLKAEITGTFPVPKSVSKKKEQQMLNGEIRHTKKPDCDNMAKIVLDALNGIAFDDDSQITDLIVHKQYGESPNVEIELTEL